MSRDTPWLDRSPSSSGGQSNIAASLRLVRRCGKTQLCGAALGVGPVADGEGAFVGRGDLRGEHGPDIASVRPGCVEGHEEGFAGLVRPGPVVEDLQDDLFVRAVVGAEGDLRGAIYAASEEVAATTALRMRVKANTGEGIEVMRRHVRGSECCRASALSAALLLTMRQTGAKQAVKGAPLVECRCSVIGFAIGTTHSCAPLYRRFSSWNSPS